jgi:hypothetical protein
VAAHPFQVRRIADDAVTIAAGTIAATVPLYGGSWLIDPATIPVLISGVPASGWVYFTLPVSGSSGLPTGAATIDFAAAVPASTSTSVSRGIAYVTITGVAISGITQIVATSLDYQRCVSPSGDISHIFVRT